MSEAVLFWILSVVTVGSSLAAVSMRNPINCAMGFIVTLAAVAGLFWLLDARVLSVLQVLIYAGAIVTLLIFVIMLLNVPEDKLPVEKNVRGWLIGMLAIAACMLVITLPAGVSPARPEILTLEQASKTQTGENVGAQIGIQHVPMAERIEREREIFGTLRQVSARIFGGRDSEGKASFGPYLLAFEILSILLLVAAVGAVILTKRKV
jgi:NADH-quinone oxidoreductase subunit J